MSLHCRAYKILCSQYRDVLTRVRGLNRLAELGRGRLGSFTGLEQLEPRVLLSGSPVAPELTDFVVYGTSSVSVGKNVVVVDGAVGGDSDVSIDEDPQTRDLYGSGQLTLKNNAGVDGSIVFNDQITIETGSQIQGDVDAGGPIQIKLDTTVDGSVVSADSVSTESNVTVAGGITEFGSPDGFVAPQLPSASVIVTDPNNDLDLGFGVTTSLAPGAYGDLKMDKQNVLSLSAGEYSFDLIDADESLQIQLDTSGGEIAIFVAGDVNFALNLDVIITGGDASQVYLETHGAFSIGENSDWVGTVFAPTGDINIAKNAIVVGAAYSGQQINVDDNASLTLDASTRLTGVSDVDPPVLAVGLVNDTGTSNSDTITSDPTISGAVTDDSGVAALLLTVTPTTGTVAGGPFDVTGDINPVDGSFVFDRASLEALLGQALTDDDYTLTLEAQDTFGNTSSLDVSLTLDTTPTGVTLATPLPGQLTNTNITVSGQVDDPADAVLLEARLDGGPFFAVMFDATGGFTFDTTLALDGSEDGTHTIEVRITDVAGNVSTLAQTSFVLDTQVSAPVITDFQQDTGVSDADGVTSDTQLVFSGTSEALSTVTVSEATLGVIGTVTADTSEGGGTSGAWTLDASSTVLADGMYTFTATAWDPAGNVSSGSDPLHVTVDTAAPAITIANPTPGLLTNTNITVDGQVTDPTGVVLLEASIDGGAFFNVAFDPAGGLHFDTTFALDGSADGPHTVGLRATDTAGNVSGLVETTIELDTQISVPVIEVTEHATGDTLTHGDVTSATVLVLGGTGDVGSTVTLTEASLGIIGTALIDASGGWVIDPAGTSFAEGVYSFTATATDDAGNISDASDAFVLVIDTTPPNVNLDIAQVGVITNTNLMITGDVSDPAGVSLLEAQIDGASGGAFLPRHPRARRDV